jgi:hypothetical protein
MRIKKINVQPIVHPDGRKREAPDFSCQRYPLAAYEDRTRADSGKSKQVGIEETFEKLRCAIPQTGSQATTR